MNIISNSCCGAYLMRNHFKTAYTNPFCWNVIDLKSYYYLIKDFDKIDFLNYELVKDENWNFSILVDDGNVKIQYIHYLFDAHATTLQQKSKAESDVLVWNKIWIYITRVYIARITRMLELNEKPVFLIADVHDNDIRKYNTHWLNKIDELSTNNDVILVSNNYTFAHKQTYKHMKCIDNATLAKFIYMHIFKNMR